MNLKIAMLAFAALALTQAPANAQMSKKTSKTTCDTKTVIMEQSDKENSHLSATYELDSKKGKSDCQITYVRYETPSRRNNPRLKASYDMPGDVYKGLDVMTNDGVAKNLYRNMNYLDFSNPKVPNDGGVMYKK